MLVRSPTENIYEEKLMHRLIIITRNYTTMIGKLANALDFLLVSADRKRPLISQAASFDFVSVYFVRPYLLPFSNPEPFCTVHDSAREQIDAISVVKVK